MQGLNRPAASVQGDPRHRRVTLELLRFLSHGHKFIQGRDYLSPRPRGGWGVAQQAEDGRVSPTASTHLTDFLCRRFLQKSKDDREDSFSSDGERRQRRRYGGGRLRGAEGVGGAGGGRVGDRQSTR